MLVGALLIFLRPLPSVSLSNYGDDNGSTIRSMFRSLVWDLSQTIYDDLPNPVHYMVRWPYLTL